MTEALPIERLSTSDRIAEEVRRLVWTGDLAAGARLNQDDLAQRFGVSRIPVREALIALAHAGVISMTPHRGAFVEPLTAEAVTDLYELYARVDGFAVAKAIERGRDLDGLIADLRSAADAPDSDSLFDRVVSARRRLHTLGGSPRFDAVARGLVGLVPGNFFVEVVGAAGIARRKLSLVADSLEAGLAETATAHYAAMLREQGKLVVDQLRSNDALVEREEDRDATRDPRRVDRPRREGLAPAHDAAVPPG